MQTAQQVEEEFKKDLRALLDKYRGKNFEAQIEINSRQYGIGDTIYVMIPSIYDDEGNTLREYCEVNLGTHFY
jgi:hypothetical protein